MRTLLLVFAAGFFATDLARGVDLTSAQAAVEAARQEEKAAYDEYYSREMARSATREIAALLTFKWVDLVGG